MEVTATSSHPQKIAQIPASQHINLTTKQSNHYASQHSFQHTTDNRTNHNANVALKNLVPQTHLSHDQEPVLGGQAGHEILEL